MDSSISFTVEEVNDFVDEFMVTTTTLPQLNRSSLIDLDSDFEDFIKPRRQQPTQPPTASPSSAAPSSVASSSAAPSSAAVATPLKPPKKARAPRAPRAKKATKASTTRQLPAAAAATPQPSLDQYHTVAENFLELLTMEKDFIAQGDEKIAHISMEKERVGRLMQEDQHEMEEVQQLQQKLEEEMRRVTERLVQLNGRVETYKRTIEQCESELDVTEKVTSSKRQRLDSYKDRLLGLF